MAKTPLGQALGHDTPWPVSSILRRLADAADHLLTVHDCDAKSWEGVKIAAREARAAADRIDALPAAPTPEPARPEPEKVLAYPPHASIVVEAKPRQLGAHEQPEPARLSAEEKKGLLMAADFIASVAERYPVEVFPPDGTSVDCHSARVMRHASKFLSAELRAMAEQDNDEELRALAAPPQEPR